MLNLSDHLQELRASIIGLVMLLATTIIGVVWISVGAYHGLVSYLGDTWAPVILGLVCCVPIIVFAFVKAFSRNASPARQDVVSRDVVPATIAKVMESFSGHSPFLVTSIAIIAGVLAARFPSMLTIFMQVLSAYAEEIKARELKNTP